MKTVFFLIIFFCSVIFIILNSCSGSERTATTENEFTKIITECENQKKGQDYCSEAANNFIIKVCENYEYNGYNSKGKCEDILYEMKDSFYSSGDDDDDSDWWEVSRSHSGGGSGNSSSSSSGHGGGLKYARGKNGNYIQNEHGERIVIGPKKKNEGYCVKKIRRKENICRSDDPDCVNPTICECLWLGPREGEEAQWHVVDERYCPNCNFKNNPIDPEFPLCED